MKVTDFCVALSKKEGKKKQIDIAQISELLRIVQEELKARAGLDIYKIITLLPDNKIRSARF